jgi:hypothetical protein
MLPNALFDGIDVQFMDNGPEQRVFVCVRRNLRALAAGIDVAWRIDLNGNYVAGIRNLSKLTLISGAFRKPHLLHIASCSLQSTAYIFKKLFHPRVSKAAPM